METYHSTPFLSGTLNGYIDMLLTCADGSEKVLDMKWSYAKYRIEELKENRQLQLATYAYLRKKIANSGDWPPQAYFIIDGAQLLTQDEKSFPGSLGYMPLLPAKPPQTSGGDLRPPGTGAASRWIPDWWK